MEILILGAILYVVYQSGALTPLGLIPSGPLISSAQQALSSQISAEEQKAYAQSQNQVQGPSEALGIAGGILSGTQAGIQAGMAGGPLAGAIAGAAGAVKGAISSIFGGMALRAKQAGIENQALNFGVQAFDQAMSQVNAAYNNGQINAHDAVTLIQQIWDQYWGLMASKIQPNRNGCSSGSSCPGTASQYGANNGAPAGYCAGTIGATCCVGCGPIRLSIERSIAAITAGGGAVMIAPVGGDRYGLQTRLGYQLTWGHA